MLPSPPFTLTTSLYSSSDTESADPSYHNQSEPILPTQKHHLFTLWNVTLLFFPVYCNRNPQGSYSSHFFACFLSHSWFFSCFVWLWLLCEIYLSRARVSPPLNRLALAVPGWWAGQGYSAKLRFIVVLWTGSLWWPFLIDQYKESSEGRSTTSLQQWETPRPAHNG